MTTMRSITGHSAERHAQDEKVNLLVNVLDQHAHNSHLDPHTDAEKLAEAASSFTKKEWGAVCYYAGCGLPSYEVVAAIVKIYMRRADIAPSVRRTA